MKDIIYLTILFATAILFSALYVNKYVPQQLIVVNPPMVTKARIGPTPDFLLPHADAPIVK